MDLEVIPPDCLFLFVFVFYNSLPIGGKDRGVLGVGSIHVAILLSCQEMKTVALVLSTPRQPFFRLLPEMNVLDLRLIPHLPVSQMTSFMLPF